MIPAGPVVWNEGSEMDCPWWRAVLLSDLMSLTDSHASRFWPRMVPASLLILLTYLALLLLLINTVLSKISKILLYTVQYLSFTNTPHLLLLHSINVSPPVLSVIQVNTQVSVAIYCFQSPQPSWIFFKLEKGESDRQSSWQITQGSPGWRTVVWKSIFPKFVNLLAYLSHLGFKSSQKC